MFFVFSFFAFTCLIFLLAYYYRHKVISHLPTRIRSFFPRLSHYTPLATFAEQVSNGLTSDTFDIESNIRDGDSRSGLDECAVREVHEIMRREGCNFDQARLIRHNMILAENGIDPSGMPLDVKAVTRL